MLDRLKSHGPRTDEGTIRALLQAGEESFFHLAQFVTSEESWDDSSSDTHPWAPYCALSILAKMRHYRALLAITTTMINYAEQANDWLIEDAPSLLAHMGPDAIRPVTALMRHRGAPILVRTGAETALLMIASNNPETKSRIIESIKACAMDEPDIKARDEILGHMLYLDEPDTHKYLVELVEKGSATEACYDLYEFSLGRGLSGDFEVFLKRAEDPLYFFEIHRYREPPGVSSPAGPNLGRNDPCACGSGRKYKKCCLNLQA